MQAAVGRRKEETEAALEELGKERKFARCRRPDVSDERQREMGCFYEIEAVVKGQVSEEFFRIAGAEDSPAASGAN